MRATYPAPAGPVTTSLGARDAAVIADGMKMRYTPLAIAGGEGARLIDADGRRLLDFSAAWALAGLGYSDRRVQEAVSRQFGRVTFAGAISSINEPSVALAERLIALMPGDRPRKVWYGLSGSDAAEAAQRMIRLATGKSRFITFIGSWHGTTDAMQAFSGHPAFASVGSGSVTKAPYPNPYRNPFGEGEVNRQCIDFLENYLFSTVCPPQEVAAVFVETVQSDAGDIVPPPGFLRDLKALCDRYGMLLVVDDIKVGLARTGRMFSFEHEGVDPDLLLLGKSIGGGLPLSAIVGPPEILDAVSGAAIFTTIGNATCTAAGLAVIDAIEEDGLVERSAENGRYLRSLLDQLAAQHKAIGDVRGMGMIQGLELVTDPASKAPDQPTAAKVVYRAWELGLVLFYAGNWGNVLEITPPLILTRADIDEGVAILDQAFRDVAAGMVSDEVISAYAGW
jgi:4-aminobutyrate aminotransferase